MKFETSISSASDLIRQPAPSKSSTLWKLKEESKTCDKLIENLELARKQLGSADIVKLISHINGRKENIQVCIKQQRDELSQITNEPLKCISDVKLVMQKINEQANIFKGTNDESYISDMFKQLNIVKSDMQAWQSIIMPPEETKKTLSDQIKKRCNELNDSLIDDDVENVWDYNAIYNEFMNELVKERNAQSEKWFSTVKPDISKIKSWSLQECENQLSIISDHPMFLSAVHLTEIEGIEKSIQNKVVEIKEQVRQEAASKWIEDLKGQIESKDQLSIEECERLLRSLEKVPDIISEKEINQVLALRKTLTQRQDELDIKSILERINNLNEALRCNLLQEIVRLYPVN